MPKTGLTIADIMYSNFEIALTLDYKTCTGGYFSSWTFCASYSALVGTFWS